MSRTLVLSAINVTLPSPHSPQRYIDVMRRAFELRHIVRIRGDFAGTIGALRIDNDDNMILHGEFYKFMDLQAEQGWFDLRQRKPAEPKDLAAIQIPEYLKPHFQFLPFVFFGVCHRLVMVAQDGKDSMSPRQAAKVLEGVLRKAGERPEITIEPSREVLPAILGLSPLRRLSLDITRPNADDFHQEERELLQRLEAQNAKGITIDLRAQDDGGLHPDEQTRILAQIAQSHGKVSGVGGKRGKTIKVSTKDHPLQEKVLYDPNTERPHAVLFSKAREMLVRIGLMKP